MATPKYVRRWESLIAALEQLDTDDLSNAAIQRVEELHEAHRNAPASSACLHKLALNTQVLHRLWSVCKTLCQHNSCTVVTLAVYSWILPLDEAEHAGLFSSGASSLRLALRTQLEASGLLEELPQVTTAAAERLSRVSAHSSSSSSRTCDQQQDSCRTDSDAALEELDALERLATLLLGGVDDTMHRLWPEREDRKAICTSVGAKLILPCSQLCVAALQHLSRSLESLKGTSSMPCVVLERLGYACRSGSHFVYIMSVLVLEASESPSCSATISSTAKKLGQSSAVLEMIGFDLALSALTPILEQHAAASSSSSSSIDAAAAGDALSHRWEVAQLLEDQVPECCSTVQELLGCSSAALLWVAGPHATLQLLHLVQRASRLFMLLLVRFTEYEQLLANSCGTASTAEALTRVQDKLKQQLLWHTYLVPLYLHALSKQPSSRALSTYIAAAFMACNAANQAVAQSSKVQLLLLEVTPGRCVRLQQLQQQQQRDVPKGLLQQVVMAPAVPATLTSSAMQDASQLLQKVLKLYRQDTSLEGLNLDDPDSEYDAESGTVITALGAAFDLAAGINLQLLLSWVLPGVAAARTGLLGPLSSLTTASSLGTPSCSTEGLSDAAALCSQACADMQDFVRATAAADHAGRLNSPPQHVLHMLAHDLLMQQQGYVHLASTILDAGAPARSSGAGELRLLGLLCSMLKLANSSTGLQKLRQPDNMSTDAVAMTLGLRYTAAVCCAATHIVQQHASNWAPLEAGLASAASATGAAGATGSQESRKQAATVLPWLLLLGRCCLVWCLNVQALYAAACISDDSFDASLCTAVVKSIAGPVSKLVRASTAWLTHSSVAAQLTAAGYELAPVLQQLEVLGSAVQAATSDDAGGAVNHTDLVQGLRVAGLSLSCFATPQLCNFPACHNVSGRSEVKLVSGSACLCNGCRTARYCGRDCQRKHWKEHKPVCKALAAAAGRKSGRS